MENNNILHPLIKSFINLNYDNLVDSYMKNNGVKHIIFPEIFEENILGFQNIFEKNQIDYGIFYSLKANKSKELAYSAFNKGIGIEVSSYYELCFAKKIGFRGNRIICSGTLKSKKYINLAVKMNTIISIDNKYELQQIIGKGKKSNIILRINTLNYTSKFGIRTSDCSWFYKKISENLDIINFKGFSFHLSGYSLIERIKSVEILLHECNIANQYNLTAQIIDIGGGIPINYLTESGWSHIKNLKETDYYFKEKINNYYPYNQSCVKYDYIEKILNSSIQNKIIANILKEKNLKIIIEPGRSLLDQVGVTLFKVNGLKKLERNKYIIGVDGNINNLSESWFDSEFPISPYLIQKKPNKTKIKAVICGNTCLEMDFLTKHFIDIQSLPNTDDIIIYVNTAGYQMDSNESRFHMLPLPEKSIYYSKTFKEDWL